ncbi:MAG: tetratricopeptide repeat protein [Pirellulales bacterium]|nr:tetratricopeptide repeat protein [Pirellulales bacterium]
MSAARRFLVGALLAVSAAAAIWAAADWWLAWPETAADDARYVGRQTCAECHAKEAGLFHRSDHDLAMQPATPETVLGDFSDRDFTHFDVKSRFFRRGNEFFVTTDNREGRLETFLVKYVFGVRPLQQYLIEFPDGRVQCLGIAWDTENQRWFHLYPDEPIPHNDPLHWTRPLQNWNYMCAECHSTNLQKGFNLADNTYRTTWSEIDVSCEACHGPGSLHVELARSNSLFWDRRHGYGLPRLKGPDSHPEIETCAPCHSRRRIVHPGHRPGKPYLDYYLHEIIDGELYYADGQILEEDYEYGSFTQSLMYHKGVRCTNCHDPHTARIKFEEPGSPRVKYTDNKLCGQCHLPTKYDTPTHHYHPDGSKPGTKCVECHMPETTYMVVDPRRDHSIRIPRPDLTVSLDIPNACNGCHKDAAKGETSQWAQAKCEEWYGPRKGPPHFAHAIAAGRRLKPEGHDLLVEVVRRKDTSAIVRSSAISLLRRYQSGDAEAAAIQGLEDPEALVRVTSVRSLQDLLPAPELLRRLAPLLRDPIRSVRVETARALALSQTPPRGYSREDREAFEAALAEYMAAQNAVNDQPAAYLNMAVIYAAQGQVDRAESEYHTALRIDPEFIPARINLAMLYDGRGEKAKAEQQFRKIVELDPKQGEAYYSLGLLLAEDEKRLEEAAGFLSAAAKLLSDNPRVHYNHGLALQKLGRVEAAEKSLQKSHELAPSTPDALHALAILYAQQGQWPRAVAAAERLVGQYPREPAFKMLLDTLREQSAQAKTPR